MRACISCKQEITVKNKKKILKSLVYSPLGVRVVGALVSAYIRLFLFTAKVRVENEHLPWRFWGKNQPVLIAMFHGRLLFLPRLVPKGVKLSALISDHADGKIISATASTFGIETVHGSSTKGGLNAVRKMLFKADEGYSLFITPDGPKGPRMTISKGTIEIARMANVPILPVTVSCKKGKIVNSWDKFMLPKLFDEIVIRWGDPIVVNAKTDAATKLVIKDEVELVMGAMQMKLDQDLGRKELVAPRMMDGKCF